MTRRPCRHKDKDITDTAAELASDLFDLRSGFTYRTGMTLTLFAHLSPDVRQLGGLLMVTSVISKPAPQVHLFQVKAAWYDLEGRENLDLWVRAADAASAFDIWKLYFETSDLGVNTRLDAVNFCDDGFSIDHKKTYEGAATIGAISWDEVRQILIAAL
jgi:hypothetical protein